MKGLAESGAHFSLNAQSDFFAANGAPAAQNEKRSLIARYYQALKGSARYA